MSFTPFVLPGQSALDTVQAALAQAVSAWGADWGVAPAMLTVRAERACEHSGARTPARAVWTCMSAPGRRAWLAMPHELAAEVQRKLYAPERSSGAQGEAPPHFAPAAARDALGALLLALGRAAVGDSGAPAPAPAEEPDAGQWARGAGSVLVLLSAGAQQGRMLLDHASVSALCAARLDKKGVAPLPRLAPVDLAGAVSAQPVALRLDLGAARLALGKLVSLEVGDVIRLDSSADSPVTLSAPCGAPLLGAYLGRVGDAVAVEIASSK